MNNFELISFPSGQELAQAAARSWLDTLAANQPGTLHPVALSGGRISQNFFTAVADGARARKISFAGVHFFWADERCVPANDAESNFRSAKQLLLDPLQIASDHTHRLRGEEAPDFACAEAEAEICRIAPLNGEGLPALDIIFLGLGEDGHVASLFPGHARPDKRFAYAVIADSPKPPPRRLTLTYEAIAAAKQVWVLASGAGKEVALRDSLQPDGQTPLAHVIRSRKQTRIFTDIQFGGELERRT